MMIGISFLPRSIGCHKRMLARNLVSVKIAKIITKGALVTVAGDLR
jgi:hypothetical protein